MDMAYELKPAPTAYPIGSYPDTVQGTPFVEAAEEKYKVKYAVGVCIALREADPEGFAREFGSMENCVRAASAAGDAFFDMWKVKWPTALRERIKAFAR